MNAVKIMKASKLVSVLLLCGSLLFIGGCSSSSDSNPSTPATHSIQGTWAYTMLSGDDTWDAGTFTFAGSSENGTYTQVNIYNVTYTGSYAVSGVEVTLDGDENFSATLSDDSHMSGTWTSDDGSESGTWTAVKQ